MLPQSEYFIYILGQPTLKLDCRKDVFCYDSKFGKAHKAPKSGISPCVFGLQMKRNTPYSPRDQRYIRVGDYLSVAAGDSSEFQVHAFFSIFHNYRQVEIIGSN
jgi:hypothetical protein